MKRQVYDYFLNLDNMSLPRDNGVLLERPVEYVEFDEYTRDTHLCHYANSSFYTKHWKKNQSINSISTSKLYGEVGIITPPVYLMKKDSPYLVYSKEYPLTIQQNIRSIKNMYCMVGEKIFSHAFRTLSTPKDSSFFDTNKWRLLYEPEIKNIFLEHMTDDCFNQFISLYLADELRTEEDRHFGNYYLAKSQDSPKFEIVIPFDHDNTLMAFRDIQTKDAFKSFVAEKYSTSTPLVTLDSKTHIERLDNIRQLIQDGVLSKENIEIMQDLLQIDYPGIVDQVCKQSDLTKQYSHLVQRYAYLWDYNRETLGRDLGL